MSRPLQIMMVEQGEVDPVHPADGTRMLADETKLLFRANIRGWALLRRSSNDLHS